MKNFDLKKMVKEHVPGHAQAFTWMLAVALVTGSIMGDQSQFSVVLGAFLLVIGAFLGDQATHLSQENHKDMSSTWIENKLQAYPEASIFLGLVLAGLGAFLMTSG